MTKGRPPYVLMLALALAVATGACSSGDSVDEDRLCEILADLPSGSPLTPDGRGAGLDILYSEAFEEMADIAPREIRRSAEETLAGWEDLSKHMESVRRTGQQREGEIAAVGSRLVDGLGELLKWSESHCSLAP
ncbi:MAG: hypothetical protein KJP22_10445 [Acidimicrobiia bacterium]|nr:hypothetical protein [Acidimicrobiia bacterium]NNF09284.1 hypothetical protein [Acidimicrobiia bacterium]